MPMPANHHALANGTDAKADRSSPVAHQSEVCVSCKRDLFTWQQRPIYMATEAYIEWVSVESYLFTWQKRFISAPV